MDLTLNLNFTKGLYLGSVALSFFMLIVCAPQGCSVASASPEPVTRQTAGPSVRQGSTHRSTFIWVGGGRGGK